jgi:hypothetical protein
VIVYQRSSGDIAEGGHFLYGIQLTPMKTIFGVKE